MKKNKKNESGRSMLEMLGVLALLVLLTLGGVKSFDWLKSGTVAKDVITAVVEEATIRHHAMMAKNTNETNRISREGPHGVEISVENGATGTLEDYFWVEIGDVSKNVCSKLLEHAQQMQTKKTQPELVAVTDGYNDLVSSCTSSTTLKFLFSKTDGTTGSNSPTVRVRIPAVNEGGEDTICSERLCPAGARCTGDTIICQPGYRKLNCGTCDETCLRCSSNTITSSESSTCEECTECTPKTANSKQNACVCPDEGNPCTDEFGNSGYTNAECECVECLRHNDCGNAKSCHDGHCECDSDGTSLNCPEGTYAYNSGDSCECVECVGDGHCTGEGEYCAPDHTCKASCGTGATLDSDLNMCVCDTLNGYYGSNYTPGTDGVCTYCKHGWDGTQCYGCGESTDCKDVNDDEDGTKICDNHECKDVCADFTATTCVTGCSGVNHEPTYTYAGTNVYYNNDPSTHKHCNGAGQWRCDIGYLMDNNRNCFSVCDSFSATTCTTACTPGADGTATYTYAGTNVYYNNNTSTHKHCDGRGQWECDLGYTMNSNGECKSGCDGFTATQCITACTPLAGETVRYTYAGTNVYYNNNTSTHKHCDGAGKWVCDTNYGMNSSGNCTSACDSFSATTCTTGCTRVAGGGATYTYAANGTSCGTNQICNGSGSCVCKYGSSGTGCKSCEAGTQNGCSGGKWCKNGTACVECISNSNCSSRTDGKTWCDTSSNVCVGCNGHYTSSATRACPSGKPYCQSGVCKTCEVVSTAAGHDPLRKKFGTSGSSGNLGCFVCLDNADNNSTDTGCSSSKPICGTNLGTHNGKGYNSCNIKCGSNAQLDSGKCKCNKGYYGNGQTCTSCGTRKTTKNIGSTAASACYCSSYTTCSSNSDCAGSKVCTKNTTNCTGSCACPSGYSYNSSSKKCCKTTSDETCYYSDDVAHVGCPKCGHKGTSYTHSGMTRCWPTSDGGGSCSWSGNKASIKNGCCMIRWSETSCI